MRYQVPQFIDVEDKVFGPFTIKQFLYIGGGLAISFIIYRFLPLYVAFFLIIPTLMFFAALAFYRPNDKPFIALVESALLYAIGNKLYVWKKTEKKPTAEVQKKADDVEPSLFIPKLSDSKLSELSWSLDVNESLYSGVKDKSKRGDSGVIQ